MKNQFDVYGMKILIYKRECDATVGQYVGKMGLKLV